MVLVVRRGGVRVRMGVRDLIDAGRRRWRVRRRRWRQVAAVVGAAVVGAAVDDRDLAIAAAFAPASCAAAASFASPWAPSRSASPPSPSTGSSSTLGLPLGSKCGMPEPSTGAEVIAPSVSRLGLRTKRGRSSLSSVGARSRGGLPCGDGIPARTGVPPPRSIDGRVEAPRSIDGRVEARPEALSVVMRNASCSWRLGRSCDS